MIYYAWYVEVYSAELALVFGEHPTDALAMDIASSNQTWQ